jgi:signal transduction histidine kinase
MMGPLEERLAEARPALAPEHVTLLEVAHRKSLRLLRLVNTLLGTSPASRKGAFAPTMNPSILRVDSIHGVELRFRLRTGRLAVGGQLPPLGQTVYVDREMYEKIVLNLISNAFKFTLLA